MATIKRGRGGKLILKGHKGMVRGVAISPDGQWIASTDSKGQLRWGPLWQGEPDERFVAHDTAAMACEWLSEHRIASASLSEIRVFKRKTGALLYELPFAERFAPTDLRCSPCGRWLAVGGQGGRLVVWDLPARTARRYKAGGLQQIAFAADGTLLVSEGRDLLKAVDPATGAERWRLAVQGFVQAVGVSPDGALMALGIWAPGGGGYQIDVHTLPERERVGTIAGNTSMSTGLAFSSSGELLAVGAMSNYTRLLRWRTGEELSPRIQGLPVSWGIALSPDDSTLATIESATKNVRLWDLERFLG